MQINKFFSIPIITRILIASALIFLPLTSSATDIHSRILKMPIVNAIDHPQGVGAKVFAEEVAKNSNGKIKIKIFPNGTLGGEQQVASAMQGGTIEVSMMSPAQIVGTVPQFIVLDFPFTLKNEAQADAVLDGPFGKQLMSYMPEKGWVGLAYMEQGYRSISNNKRPINTLEDIKGLKIRTILNPLYIDMLNALGANAIPMPFPELYTAMETKTVDGQENPETSIDANKYYEVQKYFSGTRHIYNPQMLMVSKKLWDQLSEDERQIFQQAALTARDAQRQFAREMTEKSRANLLANGMQLNEISAAELARMQSVVQPVIDKYAAKLDPELVKQFQQELARTNNL
ncbi:TRAP-type mannitol/chloroaromatic compound transport system, periplasmic component [Edwardsiella tarda]|uniref:TRAP transporter substrate-binding protein n=3 Tax=Hafniaceae TaxID=1903412 RepID=A0A2A7U1U4_EDWTA|nr:TRAP transporter substrate-binding protein [Edwardsiella tarda]ATI65253.1 TRAP transporter substrate-binding protein [Edwardsiella tarda]PEH72267.1 TRAP transporter substrate-binding protein [Edwardsiella tarda]UAL55683.1 TRAP transporter substrate-binding protein [Edwardsiella tarda]UCQ01261.1 TRAP transporter substrate-binding protein [Edwardsiella tarda ATCC 15947 = NBRC 105688]STD28940.1 TRAP-type mannitol/chloroaromatic compound transport system, periplasmic component [Edwardsiella tar